MCLGLVAGIITFYKCTRLKSLYNRTDYTYATADLHTWTSVESSFIIIAANLPTLRPVFIVATGGSLTTGGGGGGGGGGSSSDPSNRIQKRSDYQLSGISKGGGKSGSRSGNWKGVKDQFGTDTIDLVGNDNDDDDDTSLGRILPPNRIRKTCDVNVGYANTTEYGQYPLRDPEFGRPGKPQEAYIKR